MTTENRSHYYKTTGKPFESRMLRYDGSIDGGKEEFVDMIERSAYQELQSRLSEYDVVRKYVQTGNPTGPKWLGFHVAHALVESHKELREALEFYAKSICDQCYMEFGDEPPQGCTEYDHGKLARNALGKEKV